MAPKKRSASKPPVAATTTNNNNSEDVPPVSTKTVEPLLAIPSEQTAANLLFGSGAAKKNTTSTSTTSTSTTSSAQSFDNLKKMLSSQLSSIDEVITTQQKNSFLLAVEASLLSFEQTVQLLEGFLQQTSSALSANSFLFILSILVQSSSNDNSNDNNNETQLMRSLAQLLKSCSMRLELRGSVTDAAKIIFTSPSSSSSSSNNNSNNNTTEKIVSSVFRLCLQLLVAAIEAGRHANVALLSSVLDGVACAQSQNIQPQNLLRDSAQLLTSMGKFATVGAPRLRGLISAWNAPVLPAKKEAMVVKGGPFKINVAPEFEVKHVTVKL